MKAVNLLKLILSLMFIVTVSIGCTPSGQSTNSSAKNYGASSYSSSSGSSGTSSSGTTGTKGAGGYDMPNENDKSFSDYVKRVDPDLYNSLFQ